ncbi:MAG TPA: putative metallopeptidase [Syntrophorhabdaceae bacterium]|nr:putative metallopeptidase [Syntrophorhabdaceae bacterium]HOS05774.1 putative metallopeptidase [Syntrophorhabdaceae bacterium]HPL40950.1 putative metallopeptidase [Syntrophorhabdaceae bacterium]
MGLRYEEVNEDVISLLREVRVEYFPELKNAKIKALFDIKKRKSGGMLVLARIMKTNDLLRHLTIDEAEAIEGYDYIIALDKTCWENIIRDDKVRILRHELRHAYFDIESEDNPYRLQNHSISDFYEEVEFNKDDPRWRERLAAVVEDIYEQKKEARQDKNKKKRE